MADVIRIRRRVSPGAVGAPASLANAELAYNETDHTLYIGEGTGGAGGSATVIVPVAGYGTFAKIDSPTFTGTPAAPTASGGTNTTQLATTAFVAAAIAGATAGVASFNGRTGTVTLQASDVTGVGGALLASPTFTGTPAAPTAANGTNTTQIATTQYVRSTRLDQFVAPNVDVSWNSKRINNLLDPSSPQDAATKNYVDGLASGVSAKSGVRVASTANIATLSGFLTVDGVIVTTGDRVLVKDQSAPANNGVYIADISTWPRATDMDAWTELVSAYVFVSEGTVNADTGWLCTADAGGSLGVTSLPWVQFSAAGTISAGAGLTKTGNTIDVVGTTNRITVAADSIDISTSYVGQASITTLGTIATGTWSGTTIAVNKGGTGAVTLTGYVKGAGTSALTASATIPNTDITGLGTMATQNANAVAITGGTIDGVELNGGTF